MVRWRSSAYSDDLYMSAGPAMHLLPHLVAYVRKEDNDIENESSQLVVETSDGVTEGVHMIDNVIMHGWCW